MRLAWQEGTVDNEIVLYLNDDTPPLRLQISGYIRANYRCNKKVIQLPVYRDDIPVFTDELIISGVGSKCRINAVHCGDSRFVVNLSGDNKGKLEICYSPSASKLEEAGVIRSELTITVNINDVETKVIKIPIIVDGGGYSK